MDCIRPVHYARRRMTGLHDHIRHFFRDFKQDGLGRWKEKCDQKQYAMDIQCGGDYDGSHKTDLDAGISSMDGYGGPGIFIMFPEESDAAGNGRRGYMDAYGTADVCYRGADVGGNSLFHVSYDSHSGLAVLEKKR